MALRDVILLTSFKQEFANFLVNTYQAIGIGNSTSPSQPNDSPLLGDQTVYKHAERGIEMLNATVRVRWESDLIRGDIFSNTVGEIAVVKNVTNGRNEGFLRLLIDPFPIQDQDTLRLSVEVEI